MFLNRKKRKQALMYKTPTQKRHSDANFMQNQKTHMTRNYLQQLVGQISLNQPVVQSDVKQLVLRPLGQAEYLLKLQGNNKYLQL